MNLSKAKLHRNTWNQSVFYGTHRTNISIKLHKTIIYAMHNNYLSIWKKSVNNLQNCHRSNSIRFVWDGSIYEIAILTLRQSVVLFYKTKFSTNVNAIEDHNFIDSKKIIIFFGNWYIHFAPIIRYLNKKKSDRSAVRTYFSETKKKLCRGFLTRCLIFCND